MAGDPKDSQTREEIWCEAYKALRFPPVQKMILHYCRRLEQKNIKGSISGGGKGINRFFGGTQLSGSDSRPEANDRAEVRSVKNSTGRFGKAKIIVSYQISGVIKG